MAVVGIGFCTQLFGSIGEVAPHARTDPLIFVDFRSGDNLSDECLVFYVFCAKAMESFVAGDVCFGGIGIDGNSTTLAAPPAKRTGGLPDEEAQRHTVG